MKYDYEELTPAGREAKGQVEASSSEEAVQQVRDLGFYPTKLKVARPERGPKKVFYLENEAIARLGFASRLQELVQQGKVRQLRDAGRVMYKVDEIEAVLRASTEKAQEMIKPKRRQQRVRRAPIDLSEHVETFQPPWARVSELKLRDIPKQYLLLGVFGILVVIFLALAAAKISG